MTKRNRKITKNFHPEKQIKKYIVSVPEIIKRMYAKHVIGKTTVANGLLPSVMSQKKCLGMNTKMSITILRILP